MFENIKSDLFRDCHITYRQISLIKMFLIVFKSMGFHAIVVYRFGRWSNTVFAGSILAFIQYFFFALHYCFSRIIVKMYGIDIDRRAVIGKGLYIGHFAGIEIGPCEIGEFCSIHQHVKIGKTSISKKEKIPHIGSFVWIGPHAKITGNVNVEEYSTVSAGSFVINNISPYNLVAGAPARVISTLYDNRSLLNIPFSTNKPA